MLDSLLGCWLGSSVLLTERPASLDVSCFVVCFFDFLQERKISIFMFCKRPVRMCYMHCNLWEYTDWGDLRFSFLCFGFVLSLVCLFYFLFGFKRRMDTVYNEINVIVSLTYGVKGFRVVTSGSCCSTRQLPPFWKQLPCSQVALCKTRVVALKVSQRGKHYNVKWWHTRWGSIACN